MKHADVQAGGAKAPPRRRGGPVALRQYAVTGSKDIRDPAMPRTCAFILQTCALKAREEFRSRFGMDIVSCSEAADSDLTSDDLDSRDMWKTGENWTAEIEPPRESEDAARYFRLKARAEAVQAAKRAAGVADWASADERQLRAVEAALAAGERRPGPPVS